MIMMIMMMMIVPALRWQRFHVMWFPTMSGPVPRYRMEPKERVVALVPCERKFAIALVLTLPFCVGEGIFPILRNFPTYSRIGFVHCLWQRSGFDS